CLLRTPHSLLFSSFIAPSTTHTYPLSLHDALPIFPPVMSVIGFLAETSAGTSAWISAAIQRRMTSAATGSGSHSPLDRSGYPRRSEEHTSELQSRSDLVCRLLLEKKKKKNNKKNIH